MNVVQRFVAYFNRRHDRLSSERQRYIATLTVWINIIVVILVLSSLTYGGWKVPITREAVIAVAIPWTVSFVLLLSSSSIPAAIVRGFRNLGQANPDIFSIEKASIARRRKWLFYPATYLNFITMAILVEYTGRLVHSPFTAVLFSMILGGQQFSRFRLNSLLHLSFGVAITVALIAFEAGRPETRVPEAPAMLEFIILALAFLLPGLAGHIEKSQNSYATGRFPPPRLVELLCDESGRWRYALYTTDGSRPLDPMIEGIEGRERIGEAKRYAEERLAHVCGKFGTPNYELIWFDVGEGDSISGHAGSVGQLAFRPTVQQNP